jgi:hypothetical protein
VSVTNTIVLGVVAGTAAGMGIGWESSQFIGASIDIGPGLIGVVTIMIAAIVQIAVAVLAYKTAQRANTLAVQSKDLALEAKSVNQATHEIVNSQRTAMMLEIKSRDVLIDSQRRAFELEISDMRSQINALKTTVTVERSRSAAPEPDVEPPAV